MFILIEVLNHPFFHNEMNERRGKWSDLGLKAQPDTGDNGVHASASPFEALAERSNWLRASVSKDFSAFSFVSTHFLILLHKFVDNS